MRTLTLRDRARDIVRPAVFLAPATPLREASRTMWEAMTGLAVVGTARHPAGVIAERDIMVAIGRGDDVDRVTVADVMTANVIGARPDDRLIDVAFLMFDDVIRHVPVLDENGCVEGVVSVRDLLRPLILDAVGGEPVPTEHRLADLSAGRPGPGAASGGPDVPGSTDTPGTAG